MKIFGFKWVPAFCKTTRVKPDAIFRLNSNRSVPALLNLASKRPLFLGVRPGRIKSVMSDARKVKEYQAFPHLRCQPDATE